MANHYPNRKKLVEETIQLTVNVLKKKGLLSHDQDISGYLTFPSKKNLGLFIPKEHDFIGLEYDLMRGKEFVAKKRYKILISQTPCNYGGVRHWFECRSCERKCCSIFYNSRIGYFDCRKCQNLTYASQRKGGIEKRIGKLIPDSEIWNHWGKIRKHYGGKITKKHQKRLDQYEKQTRLMELFISTSRY